MAFAFPEHLGFFVLFALALFLTCIKQKKTLYILLWATIVFGIHFHWLIILLYTKSSASFLLSLTLYGILVTYFAFLTVAWFWIAHWLRWWTSLVGYFLMIEYLSLLPLDLWGYSFISPWVPLAKNKLLLGTIAFASSLFVTPLPTVDETILDQLHHTKPTSMPVEQLINEANCTHKKIIIAPESFLPYPLNLEPEIKKLWEKNIPQAKQLLIGAQWASDNEDYWGQGVYWIKKSLIKKVYVKNTYIPFVEKMPWLFTFNDTLQKIFLKDFHEMDKRASVNNRPTHFKLNDQLAIVPYICSELFFNCLKPIGNRVKLTGCHKICIFFFVNDSWFVDYFKKLMEHVSYIRSAYLGAPIVYIGHSKCKFIS
jgi:apolipoprotein N-acyltransferase